MAQTISLFEQKQVRKIWHDDQRYFSVVDVIAVLSDSINPTDYLKKVRKRDNELGSYLGTNCPQVDIPTSTGKKRKTLVGNVENIFRIIQSVPSPKAEPFKLWLAKVGYERVKEINDPEIALNRSRQYRQKQGRSEKWIQQRMMSQETRNKLTDYRKTHDINEGNEFALLKNIIHEEWAGMTVKQHKGLKGLESQNLRDHMDEAELIFTALAELSTRHITQSTNATGLRENKKASKQGGGVAKKAKKELEDKTGKSIITNQNSLKPPLS